MLFLIKGISIIFFIIAIIYCCYLFSNAIEHLGVKLKLGNNATGSILAVIGTSLPETIVPLVAIFGSILFNTNLSMGQDIAKGAIVGSPFILSTLALFLMGIILIFKYKEKKELNVNYKYVLRDCKYFLCSYGLAILGVFVNNHLGKILIVCSLLALYLIFVYRTIIQSKKTFIESEVEGLVFAKLFCRNECKKHGLKKCQKCDSIYITILQIIVSLVGLVFFSHYFVNEIEFISDFLKINPVVLSLMLTPVATELPEIVNSIIWLKQEKDDLAIANVIGAIVFQAMIPCSIGIFLTSWKFGKIALLNMLITFLCVTMFIVICRFQKKIGIFPLIACGIFYFGFLILLFLK